MTNPNYEPLYCGESSPELAIRKSGATDVAVRPLLTEHGIGSAIGLDLIDYKRDGVPRRVLSLEVNPNAESQYWHLRNVRDGEDVFAASMELLRSVPVAEGAMQVVEPRLREAVAQLEA